MLEGGSWLESQGERSRLDENKERQDCWSAPLPCHAPDEGHAEDTVFSQGSVDVGKCPVVLLFECGYELNLEISKCFRVWLRSLCSEDAIDGEKMELECFCWF